MPDILLILNVLAFCCFFPIPFFARRYGKFLPADAGTALVRSFHIPRFAAKKSPAKAAVRRRLWTRLLAAGVFWGIIGIAGVYLTLFSFLPFSCLILLWFCGLMACVDEKLHVLPDVLTVPLLIAGFFFSAQAAGPVPPMSSAAGAVFGFLLPTVTAALMTPLFPRSLGGGDFKMLTALGAWLGVGGLALVILISVVFFIAIAAVRRRKEGPYGTSLFLAVTVFLIISQTRPVLDFLSML